MIALQRREQELALQRRDMAGRAQGGDLSAISELQAIDRALEDLRAKMEFERGVNGARARAEAQLVLALRDRAGLTDAIKKGEQVTTTWGPHMVALRAGAKMILDGLRAAEPGGTWERNMIGFQAGLRDLQQQIDSLPFLRERLEAIGE